MSMLQRILVWVGAMALVIFVFAIYKAAQEHTTFVQYGFAL
jgi:hypothetical protein